MPRVDTPTALGGATNETVISGMPRSSSHHPERTAEAQLLRAELETFPVPKKVIASVTLLLVHTALGLYSVLVGLASSFSSSSSSSSRDADPFVSRQEYNNQAPLIVPISDKSEEAA
jgi:hypothetical protein